MHDVLIENCLYSHLSSMFKFDAHQNIEHVYIRIYPFIIQPYR